MKTFLKTIVGFTLALALPLILLSGFDNADRSTNSDHNVITLLHKTELDSIEYVFLGNSYCYSGIRPDMLDSTGMRSLNLGIATAGPEFYQLICDDYLAHVKTRPGTVLLLVTPMTFAGRSDNFSEYPIHRYLEKPLSNSELVLRHHQWGNVLSIYRKSCEKAIRNLTSPVTMEPDIQEFLLLRGFFPSEKVVTEQSVAEDEKVYLNLKSETLDQTKVEVLRTLTRSLTDQGIQVVYYELPTHLLRTYFSEDYLSAYESLISHLSTEAPLIRVTPDMRPTDFRNIDHMNNSGAAKATLFLAREMESRGL